MNFKKNALFLSLFIIPTMYGSEQAREIDHMDKEAELHAMELLLVLPSDEASASSDKKEMEKYMEQLDYYLTRKYAAQYEKREFTEIWGFRKTDEEVYRNLQATLEIYKKTSKECDNFINKCKQEYLQLVDSYFKKIVDDIRAKQSE